MLKLTDPGAGAWSVRLSAAVLSAAAAAIHFTVAPMHFMEATELGLFMVIAGGAQALAALLFIVHPSRTVVIGAMLGNGVIIGIFAAAYSIGLPFGPDPGKAEALEGTVVLSKLIELALILVLSMLLSEENARLVLQPTEAG